MSVQRQRERAIENSSAMLLCFMTECLKLKKKKNSNCGARYITVMVNSLARCGYEERVSGIGRWIKEEVLVWVLQPQTV